VIPEQITYICAKPITIDIKADFRHYHLDGNSARQQEVTPIFAIPTGNEKRLATAQEWAQNSFGYRGSNARYDIPATGTLATLKELIRKNDPFEITLCDLDFRGNGGRAYKVVDKDGYYFDLREDVLFESLHNSGCIGGKFQSKYLWCLDHNVMRIIREDSAIHKEFQKIKVIENTEVLKNSELVVGGIYQFKNKPKQLFFGFTQQPNARNFRQLWYELNPADTLFSIQNSLQVDRSGSATIFWRLRLAKEHSAIKKIDQMSIDTNKQIEIGRLVTESAQKTLDQSQQRGSHASYYSQPDLEKLQNYIEMRVITDTIAAELLDKKPKKAAQ